MISLDGRVAMVTGASQGIGCACAVALAKAGAQVALDDDIPVLRSRTVLGHDLHEGAGLRRVAARDVGLQEPEEDLLQVVDGQAAKRDGRHRFLGRLAGPHVRRAGRGGAPRGR